MVVSTTQGTSMTGLLMKLPTRFAAFVFSIVMLATGLILEWGMGDREVAPWLVGFGGLFTLVGVYDLLQTRHAIRRNYPILGNLRFFFEFIRPEIRQYFVEADNERVPFSRAQRALVYQRAKGVEDKRPFGTMQDPYESGYEWINHSMRPVKIANHDFRVKVGGAACTQ